MLAASKTLQGIPEADRDDLVWDTIGRVWRANKEGGVEPPNLVRYAFGILGNQVADYHRRREVRARHQSKLQAHALSRHEPGPDPGEFSLVDQLLRAIRALPTESRALLIRRACGAPWRQLAEEFGVSEASARKRYERLIKELAGHMQAD